MRACAEYSISGDSILMAILDNDGDTTEVQGSGAKPYTLKNVGGVLSCSCPAWRNQSAKIDQRTCKHLKKVRGVANEDARIKGVSAPLIIMVEPETIPVSALRPRMPDLDIVMIEQPHAETERFLKTPIVISDDLATAYPTDTSMAAQHLANGTKLRQDEKAKLYGPPVKLANSVCNYWNRPQNVVNILYV